MAELSKLGRYELRRILGRGAMGVVYEGFDPNLSRRVAVKTILKSVALDAQTERAYSTRFIQEAKAVARLNHPHIVQVYDFGVESEVAYLVMEFIEGRELRSFFEAKEKFAPDEVVRVMGELLDALDFAHEAGVIHRDVKPANVMLDAQRRAKLADFGVARIQDSAQRSVADTMVGTPAFMSPEQISGGKVDRRTDIFSAGNILYQLLTGEQPFKGKGAWTVVKAIMQDDPPRPSSIVANVSPAFDEIVNKALAKNPEQRFASAREFAAALRTAFSKKQQTPASTAPTQKGKPEPRASETELEFWRALQNSSDAAEFEFYLDQFPEGTYSQLARHKIAKLREPLLAKEAEERAQRDAEETERRRTEETARLQAEERERRAAEEKARHEAEAKAKQEAEERSRRETAERDAEERALREALEKTKRDAAAKAKREADDKARREREAQALARLKQQEEAAARAKVAVDENATVEIGGGGPAMPPEQPFGKKTSLAVPAIAAAVVIVAGMAAYAFLGRTPAPVPVAEIFPSQKAAIPPPAPAVDVAKIQRETEERVRKEFADKAAVERVAMEKAVAEKAAAEKVAAEKLATAKTAAEKATAEKAAEKATVERVAAEKAAAEKGAATKAAAEKAAVEKAAADKAVADKAAAEKIAAEKAAAEKAASEKLALEKAVAAKTAVAAAKPGWPSPGDRWAYDVRDSNRPEKVYQAVVEVQAITSSSIRDVFSLAGSKAIALTHQSGAHLIGVAPGIFSFSPYLRAFQELRVGDRWADIVHQGLGSCARQVSWTCIANARVVGKERVSVRAGGYDAWKIVVDLRIRMGSILSSGELVYWYAEEAKRIVKYQARVSPGFWAEPNMEMELVSYTPAGAR